MYVPVMYVISFFFVSVMAMIRISLASLLLACAACTSHTPLSARDQYEARENGLDSTQLLSEATDRPLRVRAPHRFNLPKSIIEILEVKKPLVPELQVGCEEGLIRTENYSQDKEIDKKYKLRRKRSVDNSKSKRSSYYPGYAINSQLSNFGFWQPPVYQIRRPYIIPVWGAPGRIPIYFPPQPILINPGYPPDNRPNGYVPPVSGYLPPKPQTTTPSSQDPGVIRNRFEDGPVWDVEESPNQIPSQSVTTTTTARPTRRRRPNRPSSTHPPIVHRPNPNSGVNNLAPLIPPANIRPPPPFEFSTTASPPPATRPSAQAAGPSSTSRPSKGRQPSNCVWAIISCCSGTSSSVSYSCFEQYNCVGAFWDSSPCDSDFARAAVNTAENYYFS